MMIGPRLRQEAERRARAAIERFLEDLAAADAATDPEDVATAQARIRAAVAGGGRLAAEPGLMAKRVQSVEPAFATTAKIPRGASGKSFPPLHLLTARLREQLDPRPIPS